MNSLIPANFGAVSTKFQGVQANDDLSSGIQSSFGLIGYKGKVWSIKYRGDEVQLMRDDGDGPRGSIEVVVLNASKHISKIWYEQGYVEGSNAAPDCFSNNGIQPEPTSAKKQCDTCALCPHNQWGSRITPAGKQGKACADSKRLAVAPLGDLNNEAYGGPMLLRVPAASLQDLAMYGQKMNQLGYPYYAVGTRISFDPAESYPKFAFNAIRPLSDEEADIVLSLREGHTVERILSENEFTAPATPAQTQPDLNSAFEQPPQQAQQAPQPVQQAQQPAQTTSQASGFGATAPVTQQGNQPSQSGTVENPQVSAQPDPTPEQPEETEEERELRELEEQMKALKAKKAAAAKAAKKAAEQQAAQDTNVGNAPAQQGTTQSSGPATTQVNYAQTSNAGQTAQTSASPSDDMNAASDFEAELDDMLAGLLPGD